MDVQRPIRDRVISILNNNDCKSFQISHKHSASTPTPPPYRLPPISSFCSPAERPSLLRHPQFQRNLSVSSSASSPPLLRYDSTSSSKSSSSMESTPSPITPAYGYNGDPVSFSNLMQPGVSLAQLPSPTSITPFMEQSMMLAPSLSAEQQYQPKSMPPLAPAHFPSNMVPAPEAQIPTPALSTNASVSPSSSTNISQTQTSPTTTNATISAPTKKNKYPCPFAQSHSCTSMFTTSGHAARHGKKHTGEKGVHCPVCDKAFTRKDNMKQHERTHKIKDRHNNGSDQKSKAQKTREAQEAKAAKIKEEPPLIVPAGPLPSTQETTLPQQQLQATHLRKSSSSALSIPSDITLTTHSIPTPIDNLPDPSFFNAANAPLLNLSNSDPLITGVDVGPMMSAPIYPELQSDPSNGMLVAARPQQNTTSMSGPAKADTSLLPLPPTLIRGFSDLDTLAQAAESADGLFFQSGQY